MIWPGTKRPPPMESVLISEPEPEGLLRGVFGEEARGVVPGDAAAGAMVSPSPGSSAPKSVAASARTADPQEAQKRAPAATGFPQDVQNMEGASYHRQSRA